MNGLPSAAISWLLKRKILFARFLKDAFKLETAELKK
jgi:hypothetical protein